MTTAFFCLVWFVAGLMTGLTSFGSNLIAVPLIAFVFEPRESILIGCLSAAIIFLGLAILYRRDIVWRDTGLLVLGTFAGMPAGIWFLKNAGSKSLLFAAGCALLLFLLWQLLSGFLRKAEKPVSIFWSMPLGVLSGVMMASVGMGGPPLVVYVYLRKYDKEQTISTINAASVGIMLGVLPWQYLTGMFPAKIINYGLIGGVLGILGIALSVPFIKRINLHLFRVLLLIMISFSCAMLLWRGI